MIPSDVVGRLSNFSGEHTFTSSTFSPPFDIYPRNITAWLAPNISIGAETFNETVIGGPATNPNTFNPAVIQWDTGNGVGWCNVSSLSYSKVRSTDGYLALCHRVLYHRRRQCQHSQPDIPTRRCEFDLLVHRIAFQGQERCHKLGRRSRSFRACFRQCQRFIYYWLGRILWRCLFNY